MATWRRSEVATEDPPQIGPSFLQDAHPELASLRGRASACPMRTPRGTVTYLVTGYENACAVLADPRLSKEHGRVFGLVAAQVGAAGVFGALSAITDNMLFR